MWISLWIDKLQGGSTTSSGWRMPMDNAYCTWRSYSNMSWATYTNRSGNRDYHLGIDIYGTGGKVYATWFSGNKVTYGGVTYYNPVYVINNNRLP